MVGQGKTAQEIVRQGRAGIGEGIIGEGRGGAQTCCASRKRQGLLTLNTNVHFVPPGVFFFSQISLSKISAGMCRICFFSYHSQRAQFTKKKPCHPERRQNTKDDTVAFSCSHENSDITSRNFTLTLKYHNFHHNHRHHHPPPQITTTVCTSSPLPTGPITNHSITNHYRPRPPPPPPPQSLRQPPPYAPLLLRPPAASLISPLSPPAS